MLRLYKEENKTNVLTPSGLKVGQIAKIIHCGKNSTEFSNLIIMRVYGDKIICLNDGSTWDRLSMGFGVELLKDGVLLEVSDNQ